ncbi:MAG TPA: N-acetyltransferase [Lapillicoccus sp.]|uniref:GNAT family N-acetyltransferase n=1 Tax=Lapillicoccus sp. TaxID=1909287 RepID=UPI002F94C90D
MAKPTAYRPERPGEEDEVREVVRAAFGHHEGVERIVDDLRASDAWVGLSFVAEHEGRVAGHVSFTRSLLDAPDRLVDVLVLSPLSVLPALQERGFGSALVRYALGELGERPEPLVFLEGSPAYYARFGFVAADHLGFRRPSRRIPLGAFQVLRLPTYEEWMTGTLVYHRIWWDHDAVGLR